MPNSELLLGSPDGVESNFGAVGTSGKEKLLDALLTEGGKESVCLGGRLLPDIPPSEMG